MSFFLTWILPVLVGAVIGYVTNDIAIKMLFRPLEEKRIFGIRVPLTPGIIPRNRHKLAVSIADTVSRELLNEEVLKARLAADDVRNSVRGAAEGLMGAVLDARLGSLSFPSGSPAREALARSFSGILRSFLSSEGLDHVVRGTSRAVAHSLGSVAVGDLLGPAGAGGAAARATEALLSEASLGRIREKLLSMLDSWMAEERSLEDSLPFDPAEAASRLLSVAYPELFSAIMSGLRSPESRGALAGQGRIIVEDLLKRLNVVQRFFVQAGQYDRKILENMDQTVGEFLDALEKWGRRDDSRERVCALAAEWVRGWANLPPPEFAAKAPRFRPAVESFLDRFIGALRGERSKEACAAAIAASLGGFSDRSLLQVSESILSLDEGGLAAGIERIVRGLLERSGGAEGLSDSLLGAVSGFMEANSGSRVSDFLALPAELRGDLAAALADKSLVLLGERAGEIVEAIQIRRTVIEKIDSLDMLSVEEIILGIMREQFVWINAFGAVLGGLIGLVQAALGVIF